MELFKICNVSLFYFSVACVFILYSVLKNENTSATVASKVNANLTKLLFVNGIILVVYFFISILIVRYSLQDNAPLRTVFCILGFTVGFCSYLYPYYLFILFKKYVYGQEALDSIRQNPERRLQDCEGFQAWFLCRPLQCR